MMHIQNYIYKLKDSGINISLHKEELKINAPKNVLSPEIIAEIKQLKPSIIDFLRKNSAQNLYDSYSFIKKAIEKAYYPLSSTQKRLYILQQLEQDSTAYNMSQMVPIEPISKDKLQNIIQTLINRHESLRTSFEIVNDEPMQKIYKTVSFEIENYEAEGEQEAKKIYDKFTRHFKLGIAPLIRIGHVITTNNKNFLLVDIHHIISDGTSIELLINDFGSLLKGEDLEPLKLQYKDYSEWQNSEGYKTEIKKQEDYWVSQFTSEIPVLNLPYDYTRPVTKSFEGATVNFSLSSDKTKKLKEICSFSNASMNMVLIAVYNILLSKLSGQEEIIIGLPISGRKHADLEKIIGMFVNTLALKTFPKNGLTFREYLDDVKTITLLAYENQDYQFENLVDKLNLVRDYSRNPIFDACFNSLNIGVAEENSVAADETIVYKGVSKFDLTLTAIEKANIIHLSFEYCTKLFNFNTIERFIRYFVKIIEEITFDIKLSEIDIITQNEKEQIFNQFNLPGVDYPKDKTIHQLIEEQVEREPGNIALVYENNKMTYRELNEKSNQLAHLIRSKGIKPDSVVGLMVGRSFEMIIGTLGILKAGGAYLPIDPEYPEDRINFMLEDSKATLLLTSKASCKNSANKVEIIFLDDKKSYSSQSNNLPIVNKPTDLAYIIYTSGTTGNPKGVMLEHKGIVNLNLVFSKDYKISAKDNILQFARNTFDASVWEIFMSLFNGATLYLINMDKLTNYSSFIIENNINLLTVPPFIINEFDNNVLSKLRLIVSAGSASTLNIIERCKKYCRYINAYGPTEDSICTTYHDYSRFDTSTVTIGIPIPNREIYIVNSSFLLQPVGVAGELLLGGAGLARGYINREDLTKEKFIYWDPQTGKTYSEDNRPRSAIRVYRTGDLCRWLPDGKIDFLGRIDHQVKIRGFRVEPGEIENRLNNHDAIKESLIIAKDFGTGQKELAAYVVLHDKTNSPDINIIREFIKEALPEYMVPSYFMFLEQFPMNLNGKIDRKLLPSPSINLSDKIYVAPKNEIEQKIATAWQKVLRIEEISTTDNFFEIGGDSIKTIQIFSKLHREGISLQLKDIFSAPTIAELSLLVNKSQLFNDQSIVQGRVSLTPIQKWFFLYHKAGRNHMNHSVILNSPDGFDPDLVKKTFKLLTDHHDALRITYDLTTEDIVQYNNGSDYKSYDFYFFKNEHITNIANEIHKTIDINKGPLVKLVLFKNGSEDNLLIIIHHLVVDGVSWRVILEDFENIYNKLNHKVNIQLPSKTMSFLKWSEKISKYANSDAISQEVQYWNRIESSSSDLLKKDSISVNPTYSDKANLLVSLEKFETEQLVKTANKAYNTEINDLLLTALLFGLNTWQGINQIKINLEGHGREEIIPNANIARTVGWFTTLFPVLLTKTKGDNLGDQIINIRRMLANVPNKGIGYGILKFLSINNPLISSPQPEITFNYLGEFNNSIDSDSKIKLSNIDSGIAISPFFESLQSIDINCQIKNNTFFADISYDKNEYKPENIEQFGIHFIHSLKNIINHCSGKISSIEQNNNVSLNDEQLSIVSVRTFEALNAINLNYQAFKNNLFSGSEQLIYPVSEMQKLHLFSGKVNILLSIPFDFDIDYNTLNASVNKLIDVQSMLRCKFQKKNEACLWNESVVLNSFHLPVINVSNENFAVQEHVKNEINAQLLKFNFNDSGSVLYYMYLLVQDDNRYSLEIIANHAIVDIISYSIIKSLIYEYYHATINKKQLNVEVIPYHKYITQIIENSKNVSPAKIQEVYTIAEFAEQIEISHKYILQQYINKQDKGTTTSNKKFIFHYDIDYNLIGDENVWNISLILYCRLISRLFDNNKVPLFILSYGRQYGKELYYNTVGEFLDMLPILLEYNEDHSVQIIEEVALKIGFARKHALNMLNTLLANSREDLGWVELNTNFKTVFAESKYSLNVFNFTEKFNKKDFDSLVEDAKQSFKAQEDTRFLDCSVRYTDETLRFIISAPFYISENILEETFNAGFIAHLKQKLLIAEPA